MPGPLRGRQEEEPGRSDCIADQTCQRRDCSKGDLEACLADHPSDLKDSGAGGHKGKTDSAFGDFHGPEEDWRGCL